jgi:hypothetical protein
MADYTLTYSESVQGFPSFYGYIPDMMKGMNNYFYSFKGGNLYRHNTNNTRNEYYRQYWDKFYPLDPAAAVAASTISSMIKSVFNDAPLENKIFKTLNLESTDPWKAELNTDLQVNGLIESTWFKKKESDWFGFVRAENTPKNPVPSDQYALRNLNGIGNSTNVQVGVPGVNKTTITFALTTNIGSIISIGDYFYFMVGGVPSFAGDVEEININIAGGINTIVIDTLDPATTPIPGIVSFFLYIKDATAESHGMLGHYCEFILTLPNTFTSESEMYAVESEVMKSYP